MACRSHLHQGLDALLDGVDAEVVGERVAAAAGEDAEGQDQPILALVGRGRVSGRCGARPAADTRLHHPIDDLVEGSVAADDAQRVEFAQRDAAGQVRRVPRVLGAADVQLNFPGLRGGANAHVLA